MATSSNSKENLIASDRRATPTLSRRMALKALAVMSAAPSFASTEAEQAALTVTLRRAGTSPTGTPTDPFLRQGNVLWERSLDEHALATLETLVDIILPADDRSPSASSVGCHDFIDEWVSAPYPRQQQDGEAIDRGLIWLDKESEQRFGVNQFVKLQTQQQHSICDDICAVEAKEPRFEQATLFFTLVRNLTAGAFFTSATGLEDLQYIGNVALPKWHLPPDDVLEHLGLKS